MMAILTRFKAFWVVRYKCPHCYFVTICDNPEKPTFFDRRCEWTGYRLAKLTRKEKAGG